jgi:hypothetical protein
MLSQHKEMVCESMLSRKGAIHKRRDRSDWQRSYQKATRMIAQEVVLRPIIQP